jgi:hypothetical protein
MDEEFPVKSSKIFPLGCSIPNVKSLTFNKKNAIKFECFYETPIPGYP